MKKITVTLTDEAEKVFNEIMYSLPKEEDGSGTCSQSDAICYALQKMWMMEQAEETKTLTECRNCKEMVEMISIGEMCPVCTC